MKSSEVITVYINAEQLKQLLKDPKFIGYAGPKGGKTFGGTYANSNVIFQLKKGVTV